MFRKIVPVVLLLLLPGWSNAVASAPSGAKCVSFSMQSPELWLEPGNTASVVLSAKISKGWWIYGVGRARNGGGPGPVATEIKLLPSEIVSLNGSVDAPKPKSKYDDNFQAKIFYYKGQADFTVPIRVSSRAKPGAYKVALLVSYMASDTTRCCTPVSDTLRLTVMVEVESESMQFRQNEPRRGSLDMLKPDVTRLPASSGRAEQRVPEIPEKRRLLVCALPFVIAENKNDVSSLPV